MKYSILVKFIAIILAAVCLLATITSALAILVVGQRDMLDKTFQETLDDYKYFDRQQLAEDLIRRYGALTLGSYPQQFAEEYLADARIYDMGIKDGYYDYTIFDASGNAVESTYHEYGQYVSTWAIHREMTSYRSTDYPANVFPTTKTYYDETQNRYVEVKYVVRQLEDYTVRLYLKEDAYETEPYWNLVAVIYNMGYWLFAAFGISLLLFIAAMVYLLRAAGRTADTSEVRPRGLSRLPLDIYSAACCLICGFGGWLALYLMDQILQQAPKLLVFLTVLDLAIVGLTLVGYAMAWAAQIKMKQLYWLKNTLIGRIFRLLLSGLRRLKCCADKLFRLLPMIWQWFVTMALMVICPLLCIVFAGHSHYRWENFWALMFLACLLLDLLIVLYVPICFGILYRGVKKMRQGDLTTRINTRFLFGPFLQFAQDLNSLSDTIALAVRQQMRSERMKAELITNVSHDIKTPLTSIINFVDLLQQPHTDAQQQEYLDVLARQSAQMKKLISDLTELSKANSGNIAVNAQKMDAVEAVNQALGEFSDKLDAAGLTPVFLRPEAPTYITADGRLVWRVLSNLLENAAKYALPGTRLYLQLYEKEGHVALSVKNISREPLTATAEELLERFVQGDASRNTEGSGLGLNIAKGLMEAQQGSLGVELDGDLFKVTLTFPPAR